MRATLSSPWAISQRQLPAKATVLRAVSVALLLAVPGLFAGRQFSRLFEAVPPNPSPDQVDTRLQQAASSALGDRDGTVLIVDPETGRIRAVVSPELAFENSFSPGSTIKPFTTLAALRAKVIDHNSRTLCREEYNHEAFHTVCSHPRNLEPLNASEALAYSCNYYFAKIGARLEESDFNATVTQFGFGRKTSINWDRESAGKLMRRDWQPENAIGEGHYLAVTPVQLLMAYTTLVNGGRLFIPKIESANGFTPIVRTRVAISGEELKIVTDGLEGAVRYGTAERAGLNGTPLRIIGKTGTSTQLDGFRSQAWFVGFASDVKTGDYSAPTLGVLVFLKRGHGYEAAEVSRRVFEEYASASRDGLNPAPASLPDDTVPSNRKRSVVRVYLGRENITREMPLEDYVAGVVAAEGSMESELDGLKALAVASRTYALKNLGRHRQDGFDFCTATHCQRFSSEVSSAALRAVKETEGQVLLDDQGQLVDSYFSASCGGATANISTLWNGPARPYLSGVKDEYCLTMPHNHWTDVIETSELLRALQSDKRTNIGNRLDGLVVSRRDKTGRAELIRITGERSLTVSGWDFKIIVGRILGWNLLKSSRFEISRTATGFVFRGSGFGHGLGLCQEGAHVMAESGFGYQQILKKYFPGTRVGVTEYAGDLLWVNDSSFRSVPGTRSLLPSGRARRTLANEHFRLSYPATMQQRDAEYLLQVLEAGRSGLLARTAFLDASAHFPFIEVYVNDTTGDFVGRTGWPWWAAAATRGATIELQPLEVLKRRRILETTLRHELVHKLVEMVGGDRTPRWLSEGLALYLAGEGPLLERFIPRVKPAIGELEKTIAGSHTQEEMRMAYAAAYAEVRRLIAKDGERAVWRLVARGK